MSEEIDGGDHHDEAPPPKEQTVESVLAQAADDIAAEREAFLRREDGYRGIISEFMCAVILLNREDRRGQFFCCCGASIFRPTREKHTEACLRLRNLLAILWEKFEWVPR